MIATKTRTQISDIGYDLQRILHPRTVIVRGSEDQDIQRGLRKLFGPGEYTRRPIPTWTDFHVVCRRCDKTPGGLVKVGCVTIDRV